jgi:hypothetical protein
VSKAKAKTKAKAKVQEDSLSKQDAAVDNSKADVGKVQVPQQEAPIVQENVGRATVEIEQHIGITEETMKTDRVDDLQDDLIIVNEAGPAKTEEQIPMPHSEVPMMPAEPERVDELKDERHKNAKPSDSAPWHFFPWIYCCRSPLRLEDSTGDAPVTFQCEVALAA